MAKLFRLFFVCLTVDCVHFSLKFCHFFSRDGRLVIVIVVVEEHGEHVGHGLALWVAHGVGGGIDALGDELVLQSVALAVATYDAANLPEADVVEKFTAGDSDFAHEQLVDVVGVA